MFGKSSFFALALVSCLAAPSLAQDAGVSGIPRGPGSAGGLNNSVNDPSGIGNAGRVRSAAAKHGGARGAVRRSVRFQPGVFKDHTDRAKGDPARGARIPPRISPFVRFPLPGGKTARFKVEHLPGLLGCNPNKLLLVPGDASFGARPRIHRADFAAGDLLDLAFSATAVVHQDNRTRHHLAVEWFLFDDRLSIAGAACGG